MFFFLRYISVDLLTKLLISGLTKRNLWFTPS